MSDGVSLPNSFDIVIAVGPNDKEIIRSQMEYTKPNIIGYRNIYLVSYDPSLQIDGCITIPETMFPFSIETVSQYHGKLPRNGWYLQQLLKLYSSVVIPDLLERYLVIDSDTFFLKPTTFVKNGRCLYNYGSENHTPYFDHMRRVDPELTKVDPHKSGICHHMMFETTYLLELMRKIEAIHREPFYVVFLKMVSDVNGSGASEYEIYFHYMLKYHRDEIEIRPLNWRNGNRFSVNEQLDYISYHWYMR